MNRIAPAALAALLGVFAVAAPPPASEPAPVKYALLIGINDYRAVSDLAGCVNDVELVRSVLASKFGFEPANITLLTDGAATRRGVLAALDRMAQRATRRDIVYVHYSGHGSRMIDSSGDETDGWDETIVPHDSRTGNVFDISDDELNVAFAKIGRAAGHLAVVLDSCHSGSATRAGATARRVEDDLRPPPRTGPTRGAESTGELRDYGAEYVLIAGCRPYELSNEYDVGGVRYGALTRTLMDALQQSTPASTYRDVTDHAANKVSATFPSQHPNVEGPHADRILFGSEQPSRPPLFAVSRSGEAYVVDGGSLVGLGEDAELDVFPPTATTFDQPVARLKVTRAEPLRAHAVAVDGGSGITAGARAAMRTRGYPDFQLSIAIEPDVPAPLAAAIRSRLHDYAGLLAPEGSTRPPDLLVRRTGKSVYVAAADLAPLSEPQKIAESATPGKIADQLVAWSRWLAVRGLSNQGDARVTLSIENAGEGAPAERFAHGDTVEVRVKNESTRPLYVTILDLSSDGSIAVWHPTFSAPDQVAPGVELVRRYQLFVPEGRESVDDTIKVLATDGPLAPGVFAQAPARSSEARPTLSSDARLAFIEATGLGLGRGGNPVPLTGWSTVDRTIRIERDAGRTEAFLLHFDQPRSVLPGVRGCGPGDVFAPGDPCLDVTALDPSSTILEARLPANPDGTRGIRSAGSAWDEAYRLRQATGAARVEPSLEAELGEWVDDETPSTRGGVQRPDKEGVKRNPLWSLQHIRAAEAWEELHRLGRRDGEEGGGVIVGHPDTGYRQHPEIWSTIEASSPVVSRSGWDYYENDSDALDPLDSGVLANPGHGTKSSSVIISPKGKQGTGTAEEYVSGVAPGARLMPLRVHKSVVHFDSRRLARAIFDAAGDDRARAKQRASLISISMGGLPSWALWRAVKFAEEQGVIVVAAAGNEVGFVVWPARFGETVAVAASNVDCGIWGGSSRGPAVDITAPGESVWMASTDTSGAYTVGRGQGTTYATATTAGVAALWLDRHRDDPRLAQLRAQGKVTQAFRGALQATAWRPDGQPQSIPPGVTCKEKRWDPRYLGPGIVNAAAVLRADLTVPGQRDISASGFADLPLFATLFPPGTPPETVRARFGRLVGAETPAAIVAAAETEGEITMRYAVDGEVRAALERLTVPDGEPPAAAYGEARAALLRSEISGRLRRLLEE